MRGLQWVGERANKSLDAKNPSQALLNSMGVFVRVLLGEGDAALQAVGSQTVLLHLTGRWKIWRCWQGDQKQAGGTVPPLCLKGPQPA